ncbi:hypothetical protein WG902_05260 [Ramlibacter sp. PS3R-8]|uniref:hypothetical protein n=1 Tax=Ramlibacter sp. PS3R-8 TaxID=3133437 RepID=UPI0030B6C1F6
MASGQEPARERDRLMVQLHPWPGERLARETLRPSPAADTVAYGYLGDLQLRLVFDEPGVSRTSAVRPDDLARLELTPQKAVAYASSNSKRASGAPQVTPLDGGIHTLRGQHADYNATFMLDRTFWRQQLEKFPQGLLAAVPRKGVLMFAPAGDAAVEAQLQKIATRTLASAGAATLSACIYRFDATGWQPYADLPRPQPQVAPVVTAAARKVDDDDDDDEADAEEQVDAGVDLDKVANGQRMLVLSILGSLLVNGVARSGVLSTLPIFAMYVVLGLYSLVGVVRLSSGLGKPTPSTILYMVLTFVPLVSLGAWIWLSVQATRQLRAAGWRVGLLGARP